MQEPLILLDGFPSNNNELHGFSDASQDAYAAVIYLKSGNSVNLICYKTKVCPVKGETIPHLELCGAWLLSKLIQAILPALKLQVNAIHCWTDSNIVLGWLASSEKLPIFVNNRVRSINKNVPDATWHHIAGVENPADMASRGISAKNLINNKLWLG